MVNLAEDEFRTYDPERTARMNHHSGAVLAGPHARSTVLDTREFGWLAAVEFRSGRAGSFFSMPMTEVCNQVVPLDDLWGHDGRSLRERLLDAPTPASKFHVFEEVLLEHLAPKYDPAIQYAIAALRVGRAGIAGRLASGPFAPDTDASVFRAGWNYSQAVCPCAPFAAGLACGALFR